MKYDTPPLADALLRETFGRPWRQQIDHDGMRRSKLLSARRFLPPAKYPRNIFAPKIPRGSAAPGAVLGDLVQTSAAGGGPLAP
jgi:hypothetical protein